MSDMMTKLAKILNQAERASTPEEADAFLSAAQALSTKYSIDMALARAHTAKNERTETPEKRMSTFEGVSRNNKKHLVNLFHAIAQNNDTRIDIAHNSTYVIAYGFTTDLDVVEAMFAHLSIQMVDNANKFIESGEYKNETEGRWVRKRKYSDYGDKYDRERGKWFSIEETWEVKPIDGRVARSSFYEGFTSAINKRLREARREAVQAATVESKGTELALIDKTKSVSDYYKSVSNARGSWSGTSSSRYSNSGYSSGRSSGESARIGGQGSIGGRKAINA